MLRVANSDASLVRVQDHREVLAALGMLDDNAVKVAYMILMDRERAGRESAYYFPPFACTTHSIHCTRNV